MIPGLVGLAGFSGNAADAAIVDYAYAENLSTVSVAHDAGFDDVVSLAFTPDAADYVIISQTDCVPVPTSPAVVQFVDGVSTMSSVRTYSQESTPSDKFSMASLNIITGDGSTARTFKIEGDNEALSGNASFTQSRISALKLGPDDEYAQDASVQATSSTTYAAMLTLNFTPPTAGDYYIIFHVKASGSGAVAPKLYFSLDGVDVSWSTGGSVRHGNATANYQSFIGFAKLTAASGLQTCQIYGGSTLGGTNVEFKDCTILAIRADRFADIYWTGAVAATDGAETTYTTVASQTFTPDAVAHLTLMAATFDSGSSTASGYMQALDGAEVLSESVVEGTAARIGVFGHQIEAYAAASRTQALQRKSESTNTTNVVHAGILSFSLAGLTSA